MTTIQRELYPEVMDYLENFGHRALPIFHLVRGICVNDSPWNCIEFIADQWPEPHAVICRPTLEIFASGEKGYVSRQCCRYTVSVWSRDDTALRNMLETPGVVDWKQEIMFHDSHGPHRKRLLRVVDATTLDEVLLVRSKTDLLECPTDSRFRAHFRTQLVTPNVGILDWTLVNRKDRFQSGGLAGNGANDSCASNGTTMGYDSDFWCCDVFEIVPDILVHIPVNLPEEYTLGELTLDHVNQVSGEWDYGGNQGTVEYLTVALDPEARPQPTAAILDNTGRAISYALAEPEGNMAMGYTHPDHRNKGLFRIVNYVLAMKLFARGRKSTYGQITAGNIASRKPYLKIGARIIPEWKQHWLLFTPHGYSSPSVPRFNYAKRF